MIHRFVPPSRDVSGVSFSLPPLLSPATNKPGHNNIHLFQQNPGDNPRFSHYFSRKQYISLKYFVSNASGRRFNHDNSIYFNKAMKKSQNLREGVKNIYIFVTCLASADEGIGVNLPLGPHKNSKILP